MQCKNCGLYISGEYHPKRIYCSDYCGWTYRGKCGGEKIRAEKRPETSDSRKNTLNYQHRETSRTVEDIMVDILEESGKLVPDQNRIKELFEEKRLAKVLRASL